ncbi:MAG: cytochrome c5 family protein [Gammaproteobacteria bacterium]|nr:MAG: cytochrome c5 family protein [Gammaproteobacteria bacterium]
MTAGVYNHVFAFSSSTEQTARERGMSSEHNEGQFRYFVVVVLGVVAFIAIVGWLVTRSAGESAPQQASSEETKAVEERTSPVGEVTTQTAQAEAPAQAAAGPADGEQVFKQVCTACHGMGIAGAPKFGDKAAWADRIAQGKETLYTHALNGFTGSKGMMPPKGGNASLTDEQVKAAVDYMVANAQ